MVLVSSLRAALLTALLILAGLLVPAPAHAAAPARLAVAPAAPVAGERVVVTGTVGSARPVRLQARAGRGWRVLATGRSSRAGRFTVTTTLAATSTLRVLAPRSGRRKQVVTAERVVPVAAQSARLTLIGTGTSGTATAAISPVRAGRPVLLEALSGGAWRTVGAAAGQSARGGVSWSLSGLPRAESRSYRVRVPAWRGIPSYTGGVVGFRPTPVTWAVPQEVEALAIDTTGGAPVESKDTYVAGAMTLDGATRPLRIKGRGNSTWGWPKKPYRIKLDSAASLLGLPAEKDWALLANHGDPSLLRNWAAFALADRTRLGWNPHGRFVDLTLNGVALGSYLLVEVVERAPQRVALPEDGLLLEVDERYSWSGEPGYTTERGMPIAYKDPDDPTAAQVAELTARLEGFEDVLASIGEDPEADWSSYVDTASFVDWYLVQELFKNLDADFYSSIYLTWQPGQPFRMGPVWDFDLSSGFDGWFGEEYGAPTGWYIRGDGSAGPGDHARHDTHWLTRLLDDPAFAALVEARWATFAPIARDLVAQLPAASAVIHDSAAADLARWPDRPWGGMVHGADHPEEVAYLAGWLDARITWLDGQLS
ncbi:CotH protein [Nocardioides lianchengensis]|uniref:CotH protein n=1 Tax=Nocardioides lianchengensis TaxID=1045774 RepID=A0A1G6XRA2_9ACTN|nr:CotH protein [Nocardioides lianchengensis]